MLKSGSSRIAAAHKYVNAMLNVAYITGFVRQPEGRTFLIQQKSESADLVHAISVQVGDGIAVPREFTPITATCHVYGGKSSDGLRNAELRVIDMRTPSTRSMPLWLAWNASMPEGIKLDGFNPFRAGTLKAEYTGQNEVPDDPLRLVLEATRGRLDTRLGDNANVAMLAGVVEGARSILKPTRAMTTAMALRSRSWMSHPSSAPACNALLHSAPNISSPSCVCPTVLMPGGLATLSKRCATMPELVVAGDGFWFTDHPKHATFNVETRSIGITEFCDAVAKHERSDPLFFGDDVDALRACVADNVK